MFRSSRVLQADVRVEDATRKEAMKKVRDLVLQLFINVAANVIAMLIVVHIVDSQKKTKSKETHH